MELFERSRTYVTAQFEDTNAIKTSIASAASAQSYSGAALDGATVTANVAYPLGQGSDVSGYPCAELAANVGSYVVGSKVTFTGTRGGKAATSVATVTDADGGETIIGNNPLDTVTQVDIEAQVNTGGSWQLGWSGIAPRYVENDGKVSRTRRWMLQANAAGSAVVGYGSVSDTVPLIDGAILRASPTRVKAGTLNCTIYERD